MSYVLGNLVRVTFSVTDEAGTPADPDTVTLRVQRHSDTETVYVNGTDAIVVKDATGEYHADLDPTDKGLWHWRWEGTGTVEAAAEGYFSVTTSFAVVEA